MQRLPQRWAPDETTFWRIHRAGRASHNPFQPDMSSGPTARRFIMFRILAAFILAAFAFAAQAAVDANKASQAELETVKGIGPGLSSKILDARKAGAFKDWNDLVDRVGGVGPGNAARFSQAGLTVNNVAYSATAAAAPDKAAAPRKAAKPADTAPAPARQ
jgi:competence protein ComEA